MRIAVAMSGGVDSSVAALILKNAGHDVFGLTMSLLPCGSEAGEDERSCCGHASVRAAGRVAHELGISHHVVSLHEVFEREVISDFVSEYSLGRTPNPCVRCNEFVKFGELMRRARGLGAEALATGHHARVITGRSEGPALARGRDRTKDQSYFLYRITSEQLERVRMPVGELDKSEVRALAREAGLHTAGRKESQDVCFVPGRDAGELLRDRAPSAAVPGPIVDTSGRLVGEHRGIGLYTVGQRSGLGISARQRSYVVAIEPDGNTVVVGTDEELRSRALEASRVHWIGRPPESEFRARAAVRSTAEPAPCTVRHGRNRLTIGFDEPQRAVCPGQSAVVYDGDIVLGGGTITAARADL